MSNWNKHVAWLNNGELLKEHQRGVREVVRRHEVMQPDWHPLGGNEWPKRSLDEAKARLKELHDELLSRAMPFNKVLAAARALDPNDCPANKDLKDFKKDTRKQRKRR